jgi:hypothetical protein
MNINKIELDLDGVVLDFKGHYFSLYGKDILTISKDEMWNNIHNHIGFYETLPLMHDGLELFNFCVNSGIPTEILTATGKNYDRVSEEKINCVRNKISSDVIIKTVESNYMKAKYATPTSLLIDDQSKSINPWIKSGGIGILHISTSKTIETLKKILKIDNGH